MRPPGTYDPLRDQQSELVPEPPQPPEQVSQAEQPTATAEEQAAQAEPERPPDRRLERPEAYGMGPNELGLGQGHTTPSAPDIETYEANLQARSERLADREAQDIQARMNGLKPPSFQDKAPEEREAEQAAIAAALAQKAQEEEKGR